VAPLLMTNQHTETTLHSFVVLFPQGKRNRVAALRGCAKDARNTVEHIIWHECSMAQWRKQSTAQKSAANSRKQWSGRGMLALADDGM